MRISSQSTGIGALDIAFCENCGAPISGASGGSTTLMSGLLLQILRTTALSISGCRIARELGIARGLTVRTRGIEGRFQAGVNAIVGDKVDAYVDMCKQARSEALKS